MAGQGDPVPNPPQHDPAIDPNPTAIGRFARSWMQWFLLLRAKINVINALLVDFSKLTGQGFLVLFDGHWTARSLQGPMSVQVNNGDGSLGDPEFIFVNDEPAPPILSVYGSDYVGVTRYFKPPLFESTGLLDGGSLSVNSPTTYNIAGAVVGWSDYDATPTSPVAPTRSIFILPAQVGLTIPSLAVLATYVGISMPSGAVVTQTSPFSASQSRDIAALGVIVTNGVNIIAVNNLPFVLRAGINQVQDLIAAIGPLNLSGNVLSANGANLSINKSAGAIFKQGANFQNDENNPHGLSLAALTAPATMAYRLSNGTQFANTAFIDPNNMESPPGTLIPVPAANRWTVQRISIFTSNLIRIQYGQTDYATLVAAENAIATQAFVTEQNIAQNGLLLGFLVVRDGATNLSNAADAKFVAAAKFGGPVGSGGSTLTNTDSLPEGLVNLYFTDARAVAAADGVYVKLNSLASQTIGTGPVTFTGLPLVVQSETPTWQFRTETGIRRVRWQYAASDATDGTFNLDKWTGAAFTNVMTINPATFELAMVGVTGSLRAAFLHSTTPIGTAPITVISTTIVTNLNADYLDSQHGAYYLNRANHTGGPVGTIGQFLIGDYTFSNTLITEGGNQDFNLIAYGSSTRIFGKRANGTIALPTAIGSAQNMLVIEADAHDGTAFSEAGSIQFIASAAWTNLSHPMQINFRTTAIGSTASAARWVINHNGTFFPGLNATYDIGTSALRILTTYTRDVDFSGAEFQSGVLNPAALAADVNDWPITNLDIGRVIRASATGAARTVTGLGTPTNYQRLTFINIGTLDLILSHEDALSVAANRFLCPGSIDYVVGARSSVDFWYDPASLRWRVLGEDPPAGQYAPATTLTTNVTSATAYNAQYATVSNMVIVSGKIDLQAAAAGACELRLSLPINATFTVEQQLGGTAVSNNANVAIRIMAGAGVANQARFVFNAPDATNRGYSYMYMYQVP